MKDKLIAMLPKAAVTKTVCGVTAAAALTTGAVLGASAYQSGMDYHPSGTERDFNANQVHFSDDKDVKGSDSSAEKNDDFVQQDDNAEDTDDPRKQQGSDYLLENEQLPQTQNNPLSVIENVLGSSALPGGTVAGGVSADTSYGVTTDREHADIVIGGRPGGTIAVPGDGSGGTPGTGENPGGTADKPTQTGGDTQPSEPSTPSNPSTPTQPSKPAGGNESGGGGAAPSTPSTPEVPTTPGTTTGEEVKTPDPIITKDDVTTGYQPFGGDSSFNENVVSNSLSEKAKYDVYIELREGGVALYQGQKINARSLFNVLDTYVYVTMPNPFDSYRAVWNDIDENRNYVPGLHFNKYIRINGVWINDQYYSFLDEKGNFQDQIVTIPEDAGSVTISTSYRIKSTDAWSEPQEIECTIQQSGLFILNQKVGANGQIDRDMLVNNKDYNPDVGEDAAVIDLYYYQQEYLSPDLSTGSVPLDKLFPGWTENGVPVPWEYRPTGTGRHVLEPMDSIEIPEGYSMALCTNYVLENPSAFFSGDDEQDDEERSVVVQDGGNQQIAVQDSSGIAVQSSTLRYYQTMIGYGGDLGDDGTLVVPEYVQAVKMSWSSYLGYAEYVKIPDTVQYIAADSSMFVVNKGYIVDDNNSAYASIAADESGDYILTNKSGDEYLHIPAALENLTIPADVKKVTLSVFDTNIRTIVIEADTADQLPEIDFGGLENATILVPDSAYSAFVSRNSKNLASLTGITVKSVDGDSFIQGDAIFNNEGKTLTGVLTRSEYYTIPSGVQEIAAEAFSGSTIKRIVLPRDNRGLPTITADSFAGSSIDAILCSTSEQAENVQKQLETAGVAGVRAILLQTNAAGDVYFTNAGETVLMNAAKDKTTFDGKIQTADGELSITGIADDAFAGCTSLQWVQLPQSVTSIGARAFYGCSALEGVLIDTTDPVTIGNMAFDNCTSMRFIGSNSLDCELDDYVINTGATCSTVLYAPIQATDGYDNTWTAFQMGSGVAGYTVVNVGSTKMLYGVGDDGTPWLALRCGQTTEGELTLPTDTIEIFQRALTDTAGSYTINWSKLENLDYIGDYVFYNTGLSGSVNSTAISIGESAFSGTKITDITLNKAVKLLDQSAFAGCEDLTRFLMSMGFEASDWSGKSMLCSDIFYGCKALDDVTIYNWNVPQLSVYSANSPFKFNSEWTWEDTVQKVHLKARYPENMEYEVKEYIREWRYPLLGSIDYDNQPGYIRLWNSALDKALRSSLTGREAEAAADEDVKQQLLGVENNIRTMFGADMADEPTDFYPYRLSSSGMITLVGAPSDINSVNLDANTLGLMSGWNVAYVGTGAFSNSTHLESVVFDSGFAGIEENAFEGVESDQLTLRFYDNTPPELLLDETGVPFSFGVPESRLSIIVISMDDEAYLSYIEKWVYPMAGYADYDAMYAAYKQEMGEDATDEEIHEAMAEVLLPVENRLRVMLKKPEFGEDGMTWVSYPQVDHISFTLGDGDDELTPTPEEEELTPSTEPGGSGSAGAIDDDAANEPSEEPSGSENPSVSDDPTDTPADEPVNHPVILPMEDGIHEIVIPAEPPENTGESSGENTGEGTGENTAESESTADTGMGEEGETE